MRVIRALGIFSSAVLWAVAFLCQSANAADLSEAEIKASYLFNFARFTEWPSEAFDDTSTPFRFCVVAQPDIVRALKGAITLNFKSRSTEVRASSREEDLRGCHVIYFGAESKGRIGTFENSHALIVSENEGVGAIRFLLVDTKIRFDVDLTKVKAAQLNVSAQMLKAALHVSGGLTR